MSLPIAGVNISLPLDWIGRGFARIRFGSGPVRFRKGVKYQINGTWFKVESVLPTGLVMRLVDPYETITEDKW